MLHIEFSPYVFKESCNSRPRILFVSTYYLPMPGAVWRRISYFAKYFSLRNWEVFVLGALLPSRDSLRFHIKRFGIKYSSERYILLNLQLRIDLSGWLFVAANIFGTLPILFVTMILRPDVLFVSMPHHDVLLMAYIAAKLSGSKLVVDLRDPPEYLLYKSKGFSHIVYTILIKLNYMLMRKADLVVTVTSGLAKLLAKHGLRANLLINGADISIFQPQFNNNIRERLRLSEDKVVLVFNGYLGDYYDPIPLLRAIAKLPGEYKERIVLLVIGGFNNSSYARKFLQIAKELQLSNNIKILRPILEERVLAEVLSAGDVGVITRIDSELFDLLVPAKFYEYLACGLPIIALVRRGSEVWEYIVKWGIGFVCDPDDYNCIITALRNIFDKNIMRNIKVNVLSMRPYIDRRRVAEKLFSLLYESLKHKGGNCI